MSIDEKIKLIDSLTRILHECNLKVDSKSKALYEEIAEKLRIIVSQLEL